jgi:hypothetical protein
MPIPPRLETEIQELGNAFELEVAEEPEVINLVFKSYSLSEGFSVASTDLLLRIPKTYPESGPDMFWTDTEVKFVDGTIPKNADSVESYMGRSWRRFSWHRAPWNPTLDRLHLHLEFINERLRRKE